MQVTAKLFNIILLLILVVNIHCKAAFAIRIGLLDNVRSSYIAASQGGYILDAHTRKKLLLLPKMKKYFLSTKGKNVTIKLNGEFYNLNTDKVLIVTGNDGFISTKGKWYRGYMTVFNTGRGLTFVNNIDLENYLLGVVPAEMPTNWNIEAHKAQAIAARSYAIANLSKRGTRGYDLKDTPEDQAYGGASKEVRKTNIAVINTQGVVMTYHGKIIPAYYHASSGGHTLNAKRVWSKDVPFVKPVPAFDSNKRKNGHGIGMSQYGANALASKGYNAYQILGYFYNDIKFNKTNMKY